MSRSGYYVEVPLGLWSSVEFEFMVEDGEVAGVGVHLLDDGAAYDLPPQLRPLADTYLTTWLVGLDEDCGWHVQPWVSHSFWQSQTIDRLEHLVAEGQAIKEENLD